METKETISYVAVILAIIALFASIFVGCYAYFNQPEEVDLGGIAENKFLIISLQDRVDDMQKDIDEISYISQSDLEDLEEYADDFDEIDDNRKDIRDIMECADADADEGNFQACIANI